MKPNASSRTAWHRAKARDGYVYIVTPTGYLGDAVDIDLFGDAIAEAGSRS